MKIHSNYIGFPFTSIYQNGNYLIEFSEDELIHAAYTVGKDSWEKVSTYPYYSVQEQNFRITMIRAFVDLENDFVKRSPCFNTLDPSEKVSINYFLGMVFCNLIMKKEFDVRWLLHLDLFEGQIDLINGKKRPDFIGRKLSSSWNAIEAKGVQVRKNSTITNAKGQLANLTSIDGVPPDYKLATVLYGKGDKELAIDVVDPKGEGSIYLKLEEEDYVRDYYSVIYLTLKENYKVKEIEGRKFAVQNILCQKVFIGLDLFIFKKMQSPSTLHIAYEIENYLMKYDENEKRVLKEENYYIGADGVYISSYYKKN